MAPGGMIVRKCFGWSEAKVVNNNGGVMIQKFKETVV